MYIIGCLLSVLLIGVFLVLSFGLSILSFLFRLFGINFPVSSTHFWHDASQSTTSQEPDKEPQKRIFEDNEGEYVDFEEV